MDRESHRIPYTIHRGIAELSFLESMMMLPRHLGIDSMELQEHKLEDNSM